MCAKKVKAVKVYCGEFIFYINFNVIDEGKHKKIAGFCIKNTEGNTTRRTTRYSFRINGIPFFSINEAAKYYGKTSTWVKKNWTNVARKHKTETAVIADKYN